MPEGDNIFRAARTLKAALAGKTIKKFETLLPHLARVHHDAPITGRTVEDVTSRGKWLLIQLSGDLTLLTHMLMNGSWHLYRTGERWKRRAEDMRIVIGTDLYEAVAFKVPIAEFHAAASLARRPGFNRLGADILAVDFDERRAMSQLRTRPDMTVEDGLLDQSLLAGIGNVYKSEIAFACRISPIRTIATLTDDEVLCLARTARKFLIANVSDRSSGPVSNLRHTTGSLNPSERLWVYGRVGEPCRRCSTPIRSHKHGPGGRVTFWCKNCQR